VKEGQRQHVVTDTLAALVYDVDATAEVLRRGSMKKKKPPKSHEVFPSKENGRKKKHKFDRRWNIGCI
jgi:hypothetical protein